MDKGAAWIRVATELIAMTAAPGYSEDQYPAIVATALVNPGVTVAYRTSDGAVGVAWDGPGGFRWTDG